ncbi:MAG: hypothetical protein KF873_07385 [Gemmataceae bacterium]|nr:hypothetical protein [Planctomycetia bacterium]MBX3398543.1 hypothetical protein [Gemmataceae bacterium]
MATPRKLDRPRFVRGDFPRDAADRLLAIAIRNSEDWDRETIESAVSRLENLLETHGVPLVYCRSSWTMYFVVLRTDAIDLIDWERKLIPFLPKPKDTRKPWGLVAATVGDDWSATFREFEWRSAKTLRLRPEQSWFVLNLSKVAT